MEIPHVLKTNIRLVLLSHNTGVYLENLCEEYYCLCNRELNYQRLGYKSLEDFLRAIPDAARLDYSARNDRIKVYGVAPVKKPRPGAGPPVHVKQEVIDVEHRAERRAEESRDFVLSMNTDFAANPRPGTSSSMTPPVNPMAGGNPTFRGVRSSGVRKSGADTPLPPDSLPGAGASGVRSRLGSGGEPVFTPDRRGLYSLSFLAENRPNIVGPLEDFFSVAGKVAEVKEVIANHNKWICVGYHDAGSARRAYKMFQSLGMKPSSTCVSPPAHNGSGQPWRGPSQERRDARRMSNSFESRQQQYGQKRKTSVSQKETCYRVYVGNLDPNINYTFTMFFDLFRDYTVRWVTMKPSVVNDSPRLCAFVLLPNREQAERLAAEFDGFVWMGRRLVTDVKEKQKDGLKRAKTSAAKDKISVIPPPGAD